MKNTIKMAGLMLVVLGIPIGACFFLRGEMKAEAERSRAARYASVVEAYQKGFAEGSKAALKCVQWNTNTSTGTIELTNALTVLNRY